jgi:hypothetical protein
MMSWTILLTINELSLIVTRLRLLTLVFVIVEEIKSDHENKKWSENYKTIKL